MEKLGIDIKLLLAQAINFLLFFYLYKKFIAKPFLSYLKNQKKKEEEKASLEEEINQKRDAWLKESELKKKELKKELQELRSQLKKEAEEEKKKILEETKKQAEIIKERALREVTIKEKKLELELKKQLIEETMILVEKGLNDLLPEDIEKKLTSNLIKNLKNKIIN